MIHVKVDSPSILYFNPSYIKSALYVCEIYSTSTLIERHAYTVYGQCENGTRCYARRTVSYDIISIISSIVVLLILNVIR